MDNTEQEKRDYRMWFFGWLQEKKEECPQLIPPPCWDCQYWLTCWPEDAFRMMSYPRLLN